MELFGKTFSPVAMDADNNAPPPQALQTLTRTRTLTPTLTLP